MTGSSCRARGTSNVLQAGRIGGGERARTDDLLRAKQALSQLSYTPDPNPLLCGFRYLVGLGRLELPTSRLSGVRSNQLSYRPSPRTRIAN